MSIVAQDRVFHDNKGGMGTEQFQNYLFSSIIPLYEYKCD